MLQWLLPAILYTVCTYGDAGIMFGGTADVVFRGCVLGVLEVLIFVFYFIFISYILALLQYFSLW